ncbi:GNAT family N-acetyltransferase [Litoribacter ruber]|uniref:GNAT family N-acetyltransferase n=1 Tax=Litoribacter ruber TaxID=702568 RepID=A0AAP2CIK8_9BACT|nr:MULTISPECIES: GNAT family protein [Litoribacter]MBS9523245.1 GNAT family N-acetyltransferase [Litoribacter alkaliphilus]MBT0810592.1 GNAT family N-acetyltransferase [Litoribacter ruber]
MKCDPKYLDFNLCLEGELVRLRPMRLEDMKAFEELTKTSDWTYFTHDLSDERELEMWLLEGLKLKESRQRIPFTVEDKQTGEILGSSSFGNISLRDQRVEIGWTWLSPSARGKGYNADMKKAMLSYAFGKVNFVRVEFKTDVLNQPARKALQKMGIKEEGILRSHTLMTKERRRDTIFFGILADEWPSINS